ncbi:hypothetical protein GCM10027321_24200 [Massilia terrae]
MAEGQSLYGQGKFREAWDAYNRARQADPSASMPISSMAHMLQVAAGQAPADKAAAMLKQAESMARDALRIDAQDPLAQEILRMLVDTQPVPLHKPTPEAIAALEEGEALFMQKRYPEALAKYELAAQRDPLYSAAWVNAGDCYFSQKQWHEAEARFRKATEIEPLNGQAWRFLADSLILQGNRRGAEAALYGGIAAQPSQGPNWDKLELMMRQDGLALKRLALVRKARYIPAGKDGKPTVEVQQDLQQTPDLAFWMMQAAAVGNATAAGKASPFEIELRSWQAALNMVAQMKEKGEAVPADPALVSLQRLAQAGQLEPAILLLMYREAYRPELEAWKKAHPDGIRAFVVSNGLRP